MTYRYEGPSDFFEYPAGSNKFYSPGQNIPIGKEDALHHVRSGHRFEGLTREDAGAAEPRPSELKPMSDKGTPIEDANVSNAPTAPVAAGQPASSPSGVSEKN